MTRRQRQSVRDLVELVREDWSANRRYDLPGGSWLMPGFQAMAVYRFGAWLLTVDKLTRALLRPLYTLAYAFVRNCYGIEIPWCTRIGRRLRIAHQSGIVVSQHAVIGDDCLIRQNVTVGARGDHTWTEAPTLGDGVQVGAGAVIIGKIVIGDGAKIGPNTVVMTDVPPGARVYPAPTKISPALEARLDRVAT